LFNLWGNRLSYTREIVIAEHVPIIVSILTTLGYTRPICPHTAIIFATFAPSNQGQISSYQHALCN